MASIINNIESFFRQKSVLSNLIAVNIVVFLLIKIISPFCLLLNLDFDYIIGFLKLPADFWQFIIRPWTFITYMFTHFSFLHILFNLLWLYWFGELFLLFFNSRQLGGLYLLGGLSGGILFALSYNLFPFFNNMTSSSYLVGASASVMAIVFATAFYRKDFEIGIIFLGNIKIIYLAIICLILDLISITSGNAGGHIAHIGGALCGILFAECIKNGNDITRPVNALGDMLANLFKKKPTNMRVKYRKFESDYEYNEKKNTSNKEIDRILDKIKQSGYSSLTTEEKKKLFDAGKH